MSTLVVGGGVAGAAVVHELVRGGVACSWVLGRPGASCASSGALDWELGSGLDGDHAAASGGVEGSALSSLAHRFGWSLPDAGAVVATFDGVLRSATGSDGALLDLAPHAGSTVAVLDWPRWGWSARRCCEALAQQAWARETRTRFVALTPDPADLDGFAALDDVACARAFAAHFELVVARCRAALEQLAPASGLSSKPTALLVGPWVLSDPVAAATWSAALGLVVGETLSPPYGLAGVRFEAARDALAQSSGVELLGGTLERVQVEPDRVAAVIDGEARSFEVCVLATGGLLGGGFQLDAGNQWRASFELVPELPSFLDGKLWLPPASARGLDVQALGIEALGRIGFSAHQLTSERLFVAGDALARRSRTVLRAAQSGLEVGARVALTTGSRAGSAAASAGRGTGGS